LQPGCVNTTEIDIKKACSSNKPAQKTLQITKPASNPLMPLDASNMAAAVINAMSVSAAVTTTAVVEPQKDPVVVVKREINTLRQKIDRHNFKISKVAERFVCF
jgi:regulator of G-protein signaling